MAEETKTETTAPAAGEAAKKAPATLRALLGEKVGMTQIFTPEGEFRSATVVKAGPCSVVRVKTKDSKDGYSAVVLGYGAAKAKNVSKPDAGQFRGGTPLRHLREFRLEDVAGIEAGQVVDIEGRFAAADYVDVQGKSKGRGFAGVMKRHGFAGLPASHGASDKQRSPGSLAARRSLGRVLPGQRMAGHFGAATTTTQKLEILSVDPAQNLIYLNGPVPGPRGGLIVIRETVKRLKRRPPAVKRSTVKRDKMGNIITEKAKPSKKK